MARKGGRGSGEDRKGVLQGLGVMVVRCVGDGWMGMYDGYALISYRRWIGATRIFALIPIDAILGSGSQVTGHN